MFEALVSAIDELAAQPLTHVDGAQVVAFEQLLTRVQAEHLRRVRAFADGGLWALDGSGTGGPGASRSDVTGVRGRGSASICWSIPARPTGGPGSPAG